MFSGKVFLLMPKNDKYKRVIIWSDDELSAREFTDDSSEIRKAIYSRADINVSQQGVYSDSSTLVREITNEIEIDDQFKNNIHFKYKGRKCHLTKGAPELLDKFSDQT